MAKLNRTCLVCGKQYHYCYSCPSDLQNPSWKNLFDNENCKKIFNILCRHGQSMITDEEARVMLAECDFSHKEYFNENIKEHLNRVFNVVANKSKNKEENDIEETKKILPRNKVEKEATE